jgi:hypothetical protein
MSAKGMKDATEEACREAMVSQKNEYIKNKCFNPRNRIEEA